jgi:hypothetical protein
MAKHLTPGTDSEYSGSLEPQHSAAHTQLHQEYQREQNRIAEMRKYPDTVLIERIKLAHVNLEAEILEIKSELEKHVEASGELGKSPKTKSLLDKFKNKINEYNAAFHTEQSDLDEIKKIRRELADFHRESKEDLKLVDNKINSTEDPAVKKVLRSMLRKVKAHLKDLRDMETKLHDITLTKKEAIKLCSEKKRIENTYKKLHVSDIQHKAPEKIIEQMEKRKAKKKPKKKSRKKKK